MACYNERNGTTCGSPGARIGPTIMAPPFLSKLQVSAKKTFLCQERQVRHRVRRAHTLFVLAAALTFPALALAYIDPGTGAYVVQSVLAVVGIVVFYVSRPLRYVKDLFRRRAKRP